ncbi:MAG: hypothetical protein ACRD2C_20560 [Acidimicrobiales bacterium]
MTADNADHVTPDPIDHSKAKPDDEIWRSYNNAISSRVGWCRDSLDRINDSLADLGSTDRQTFRDQVRQLLRGTRDLLDRCDRFERAFTACAQQVGDRTGGLGTEPCRRPRGHSGGCNPISGETVVEEVEGAVREFARQADETKLGLVEIATRAEQAHEAGRELSFGDEDTLLMLSHRLESLSLRASSLAVDFKALTYHHLPDQVRARKATARLDTLATPTTPPGPEPPSL